jgi:cytochrome c oxidase assembly protein subunit 15
MAIERAAAAPAMPAMMRPAADALPRLGVRERADATSPRAIAAWLAICCLLVFAMVVVGGVTRLTHSGLSITEWQPIVGTLPPLSPGDWDEAFAKYRLTPEYRDVNAAISLDGFKRIFWWEYVHRLLGRAIGVAFLVPYLLFLARRRIPRGYAVPLAGIFVLGGVQGAVGWLMVQSGLVDDPRVSPFRLTAHLALAFAIFGAMLWTALSLSFPRRGGTAPRALRRAAQAIAGLVFVIVLSGGFVAGIRAGFAYNTFPLMAGHVVPPEIMLLTPWWKNVFWNMATVQFDHRVLALLLALAVPLLWRALRRAAVPRRARSLGTALLAMVAVQVGLGIATLINVVPLPLAALHQAGAVGVFGLALSLAHALSGNDGEPALPNDRTSRDFPSAASRR